MRRIIERAMLFNPPTGSYRRDGRCQSRVDTQTAKIYLAPVDLAQITAVLKLHSIQSIVKDYSFSRLSVKEFVSNVKSFKPDLVLINSTSPTMEEDLEYLKLVKKISNQIITLAKGGCFLSGTKIILSRFPQLDIIIRQEPEETIDKLGEVNFIPNKNIPGISYSLNGSLFNNSSYSYTPDIDKFPLPDRSVIDNSQYRSPYNGKSLTIINTSRGCPYKCIFCLAGSLSGCKVRCRRPESIIKEIKQCLFKYEIEDFLFNADTFTYNRDWVLEICSLIKREGLNIRWACNSRVDTLDEIMLKEMKEAGCWIVGFGIESGSQQIIDKIGKGFKLEQAAVAIRLCHQAGIRSHAFFVIGLPWDSEQTLRETENFIRRLNPDYFDINIAYPLPGTEFYELALSNNLLVDNNLDKCSYAHSAISTFSLTPEELNSRRKKMLLRLLLRPSYLGKFLSGRFRYPLRFKELITKGVNLIWRIIKS